MLCPICSVVFDKEATKGHEDFTPKPKRGKWSGDHRPKFSFTKSYIHFINNYSTTTYVNKSGQGKAFIAYAPNKKWVQTTQKNVQHGKNNAVKERPTLPPIKEDPDEDDELDSDFMDSEPNFDVICNVVSIFPVEYDMVFEVEDSEKEFDAGDMEEYKPMCYFVTNHGSREERKSMFKKPDDLMKTHLKPLFIQAKVDETGINKVLVDGGVAVNLTPRSLLKKIGKTDKDLKSHNVILSNYEGKVGHSLGALQVNLIVGTVVRPILFMVVHTKANFNLLIGREWMHGIGIVPSSMHQRISI